MIKVVLDCLANRPVFAFTMNDFWQNVSRYPRFFVTIILGIFFAVAEPIMPLLKRPTTAVALVAAFVAGFVFLFFTLRAMLGLA
jgi:hypothetical protein